MKPLSTSKALTTKLSMTTRLPRLILASQSPRRQQLLSRLGIPFEIVIRPTLESQDASLDPIQLCLVNAASKANAVANEFRDSTVIGADTLVFLGGQPLGKPHDLEEAQSMLRALSGHVHEVCTGVALCSPLGNCNLHAVTKVRFKELTNETILRYLHLVNVLDKAGSYAIQEHGNMIIESIEGDLDNVIGFPVSTVASQLKTWGYPCR